MKNNLIRLEHDKLNFEILNQELQFLNGLLGKAPDPYGEDMEEILHFQDTDGSFKLLDSYKIEADARVDFCHMPTYMATAILMRAYLRDRNFLRGKEKEILVPALKMCCARGLNGHGFDDLRGQIEAMRLFIRAGVQEFVQKYPAMHTRFTMMINSIVDRYREYIAQGKFVFYFGENHEQEFREIVSHFPEEHYIFVYGTLLKGQRNYDRYLAPAEPCAEAMLNGYRMFDIGSCPGIARGKGTVKGEIYRVTPEQLAAIDRLESEGELYVKTAVQAQIDGECFVSAYAYLYNRSVERLPEIPIGRQPYGKSDQVWYVAYGSNLLTERLEYYIKGGDCPYNGRSYTECTDTAMPQKSVPVEIPHDMYFSNFGKGAWPNSAVCFLDIARPGKAYGRAWLVEHRQLEEIHAKEGKGTNWYPECVRLDDIDGIPAYTFTSKAEKQREPFWKVSAPYGFILYKGMKETYPEMTDEEIYGYLSRCGK